MNKTKVIKELKNKYPNKNIVALPTDNPTEILCEIDPSSDHPEYSIAISVIDKSAPHYHKKTTKTYKVIKGKLNLTVNGVSRSLLKGDSFVIEPNSFHYAIGDETWVECHSKPGWEARDHILVNDVVPKDSRYIPLTQQRSCCVPTCIQMVMLRHDIPLLPAEEIGYHLGLVVHPDRANLFYNVRTSKEKPPAGYGTRIYDPRFTPNKAFEKLGLPMNLKIQPISQFESPKEIKDYLKTSELRDKDVLLCFNHGSLVDDSSKDWGHVCVFDRLINNKVRIIDPSPDEPKWRTFSIEKLYHAMKKHGEKRSGGFWEINIQKS